MLAKITSCALVGLEGVLIDVEVDVHAGQVGMIDIVGLPDAAVQESRERVRSAIHNSKLAFPQKRVTINLAPADLRKVGPAYDLPIAVGILAGGDQIPAVRSDSLFIGELSLDGTVRHVDG
ncbi:MAG: magnesium chelatase, partial [Chloroflexi bacterium]|nr:magnesium chelatase [Chloroflexota bacterium]